MHGMKALQWPVAPQPGEEEDKGLHATTHPQLLDLIKRSLQLTSYCAEISLDQAV